MNPARRDCISALHRHSSRWVLVATGGGIHLGAWLLSVPGGSRTVLEVHNPYDTSATDAYLGRPTGSYCSVEAAAQLAQRALQRAGRLAPRAMVVGLGITASLRSDRPKRGEHRVHVATASEGETRVWSLVLAKEARSREEEDEAAASLGLQALAATLGLSAPPVPLLAGEHIEEVRILSAEPLSRFLRCEIPTACLQPDGRQEPGDSVTPKALVPGSFNPLHDGHLALAQLARKRVGHPVGFELSVENVEKPTLEPAEIRWRCDQFRWQHPLWLTRAPRFLDKARLFPGVLFVVGADTAIRLVQPRFYSDSQEQMQASLREMRALRCRFLVAGRADSEGIFRSLEQLAIPEEFRELFEGISAEEFRLDLSSTALRAQAASHS